MSSTEEVEAAETRMNTAKDALLHYVEGGQSIDRDQHRRLLLRLKKAEAAFLKAISELDD